MKLRIPQISPVGHWVAKTSKQRRLVFVGNYGNRNIGDDAILHMLSDRYHAAMPEHEQYVFARQEPEDIRRISRAQPLPTDMRAAWWALRHADTVVVGGGGLFGAKMGPAARFIPMFALLATLLHKQVIYESVGFYTNTAFPQRWLLQLSMILARRVSVRDASSWRMTAPVRRFRTVHLVDDPAMALEPIPRPDALALMEAESVPFDFDAPVVGLSVKRLIADPQESEALTAALVETGRRLVAQGYALLFIPFCHDRARWSEQDVVYAQALIDAIDAPGRCHAVRGYYLPTQMAGIVGLCDLVIGMRFHAQVFAHALGVPLVPIGYEEKRTDFIQRYNYEAVPIDGITGTALIEAVAREEVRARFA